MTAPWYVPNVEEVERRGRLVAEVIYWTWVDGVGAATSVRVRDGAAVLVAERASPWWDSHEKARTLLACAYGEDDDGE